MHLAAFAITTLMFSMPVGGISWVTWIQRNIRKESKLLRAPKHWVAFFLSSEVDHSATVVERLIMTFLVEHNITFCAADHAGDLFWKMFPWSKEAQKYACACTKTAAVVKAMASWVTSSVFRCLRSRPFSIGAEGSSDAGYDTKLYSWQYC